MHRYPASTKRNFIACPRTGATTRRRRGQALVECIVAIFLLAVTALTTAASVRGTLALTDDATLVSRAQALATTRVERTLVGSCAHSASGSDVAPRVKLLWQQRGASRLTQTHLALTLVRAPIAFAASAPVHFELAAGGVCP